ncbi:MAG: SCO family protein [Fimbriimonadaceae bacterium]|nr:SCO family protein [Fimbriimonadaceae bacterium]
MIFRITATFGLAIILLSAAAAQFYEAPKGVVPGSGRVPAAAPSAIRVDQRLNAVISDNWQFKDHTGKLVTSGEIFSERPTILLLAFYKCTGVCSIEIESLKKTIRGMKKDDVGDLYNLAIVSIDPTEGPKEASAKRDYLIETYDRKGTDRGFKFLTGDMKNIQGLADEVGFRFYRDEKTGNITHPAGIMIISPERRIIRYFLDQQYDAKPVLLALQDARNEVVGEKDDRPFFMACINVDPLTGKRSINVMNAVRTGGVITVLAIIGSILIMNRSTKQKDMRNRRGDQN